MAEKLNLTKQQVEENNKHKYEGSLVNGTGALYLKNQYVLDLEQDWLTLYNERDNFITALHKTLIAIDKLISDVPATSEVNIAFREGLDRAHLEIREHFPKELGEKK